MMVMMGYVCPSESKLDNFQSLQSAVHKLLANLTIDVLNI
jgi:hypothetical protein